MNLHDVLDIVCDHLPVGALGRLCRCSKGIRNALTGNEALWTSKLQMKRFVGLVQMNRLFENPQRCVECGKISSHKAAESLQTVFETTFSRWQRTRDVPIDVRDSSS